MKNKFSSSWNSSIKPNKQRKFRFNAPLHTRGKFLNAHLSKELRKKYNMRSVRLRTGDKVRILRGQFKKQEGKIEEVNVKKSLIYVSKSEHTKRDGTKARYPIQPSNVMVIEINSDDKKRFKDHKTQSKKILDNNAVHVAEKKSASNTSISVANAADVALEKKSEINKTKNQIQKRSKK